MVEDLHDWMRAEQGTMSQHNPVAKAIAYMFKKNRWAAFTLFIEGGARLPDKQRGRARTSRYCLGTEILALRRLRAWRQPRRLHVFLERHRQDERRRSPGLAC